jgi:G3E family GTPase
MKEYNLKHVMSNTTTIIGGDLGAGKTTFLRFLIKERLILNLNKTGIIVGDAAGQIDFDRLLSAIPNDSNASLKNVSPGCATCDGPDEVVVEIMSMQSAGRENIVVELSGQTSFSKMKATMDSKRIKNTKTIYLLDPKNYQLVGAVEEIPHAHLVVLTKDASNSEIKELKAKHPTTLFCTFDQKSIKKLNGDKVTDIQHLLNNAPEPTPFSFMALGQAPTHHNLEEGETFELYNKIYNPYHTVKDLQEYICSIAEKYARVKGHVRINEAEILSFDGVSGIPSFEVVKDTKRSNGNILLASSKNGEPFFITQAQKDTQAFTEKPEYCPVINIYSDFETFQEYISKAIESGLYDSALAAALQCNYEDFIRNEEIDPQSHKDHAEFIGYTKQMQKALNCGSDNKDTKEILLLQNTLKEYTQNKIKPMPKNTSVSRSKRLDQMMAVLYEVMDYGHLCLNKKDNSQIKNFSKNYLHKLLEMEDADWKELISLEGGEEKIEYIFFIAKKIKTFLANIDQTKSLNELKFDRSREWREIEKGISEQEKRVLELIKEIKHPEENTTQKINNRNKRALAM